MTEIKRASTMSLEEIREVLEGMDWTEIHRTRYAEDTGRTVVLYNDGEISVQDSSTYFRDEDRAGVIAHLGCWGRDVYLYEYYEGFAEPTEDGDGYLVNGAGFEHDENYGKVISEEEMVEIAIREGEWEYHHDIDGVVEGVRRQREEQAIYGQMYAE